MDIKPPQIIELEGLVAYAGTTGVGKTHKALEGFWSKVSTGVNGLIIDSQGANNFDGVLNRANKASEIFPKLWAKREEKTPGNFVIWTPTPEGKFTDSDMVNRVCQVIREANGKAGEMVVLIDECSFWKHCEEFKMLCRCWRHARVTLLLTTQHLSADLGQVVLGCNPQLVIFKVSAPRSVEFLMKWHGLDPDYIREMPPREYIVKRF